MADTIKKPKLEAGFYIKVRPTYCVTYYKHDHTVKEKTDKQIENEKNLQNNEANGQLSNKAKTKLKNAVNWLICAAKPKNVFDKNRNAHFKFRVNFVTLTIPPQSENQLSHKKTKVILNTWLSYHRKYSALKNYVWKAEFHKDGRIHFHITTDTFIHWKNLRDSWNRILKRNGLLEFHYKKFGNYDPNSSDVHSTKNVKNLPAYITKYMSKNNDTDFEMKGRIWGCNYALSEANQCREKIEVGQYWEWMATLNQFDIAKKEIRADSEEDEDEFLIATVYLFDINMWRKNITGRLRHLFYSHIEKINQGIAELTQTKLNII